jgi:hypothetical protein
MSGVFSRRRFPLNADAMNSGIGPFSLVTVIVTGSSHRPNQKPVWAVIDENVRIFRGKHPDDHPNTESYFARSQNH